METALPLQQSPAFARALLAYGTPVTHDAPVILRRDLGPLRVSFASRVGVDQLANHRPRLINADTDDTTTWRKLGYRQIITQAHVAEWDVTTPDLEAKMSGAWRTALRAAQKSGLRIRQLDWDGSSHPLFAHADALARARRFRPYPTPLLSHYAIQTPKSAAIFEAYDKGHLCGAILILRHGAAATYQTAWSDARGRALGAARLLLFEAASWLAHKGHQRFDLGLVETDHSAGLARFKLGTGARLRRLGGTWVRLKA